MKKSTHQSMSIPLALLFLALLQAMPASATSFCYVKESPDGFVALRQNPGVKSRMVGRMKAGDEVQIGLGQKGNWTKVYWWHGDDRLEKGFDKKAGQGWVNRKYIDEECG